MKPRIQGVLTPWKPGSSAFAFGLRLAFTPAPARSGRVAAGPCVGYRVRTGRRARQNARQRSGETPRQQRSLGSERGLATPSPDGKGEISLGPSVTIMPVDSYSTLGRSCEPAFKWIPDPGQARVRARAARQRQTLAGGWSALGGHEVSCSFT